MDIVKLDDAKKQIKRLPAHIKIKLLDWAKSVERDGAREVRKMKGYHDGALKGEKRTKIY